MHLQKRKNFDEEDGPSYFSFLFIGGDGVATFQVLYHGNKCSPDVVTIIQPGTGFGGNWTNFQDPEMIFAQSVLQNSYGRPSYLLYGGWGTKKNYERVCWPQYSELVYCWKVVDGWLTLWKISEKNNR